MEVVSPPPAPAPAPMLRGPGRAFRTSLRLFALPAAWGPPLLGGVLGGVLLWLFCLAFGARMPSGLFVGFAAGLWLLCALGMAATFLLYIALCPVRVGVDGIAGFTFWCLPLALRWEEVAESRRCRLFGFPFLIVASGRRGRSLWIALPVADTAAFVAALAEHGGPDNPVSAALTSL